ncbi:MAG: hypothetical protein ACFE8N_15075 [Promethearchaeota archaeon]
MNTLKLAFKKSLTSFLKKKGKFTIRKATEVNREPNIKVWGLFRV